MDEIVIESETDGKTVKSTIQAPDRIKKYLKSTELFIHYDKEITDNQSILNIPLLSVILPLAWLTDTNIKVETLDKRYRESMYHLKDEMNKIYPLKQFKTEINAEKIVENRVNKEGTALLFSGGVDSTYSLINNWEKKPHLIMMWGIDAHVYPEYSDHWNQLESIYSDFAHLNGMEYSLVKTNACKILDNHRIEHDYSDVLNSEYLRMTLQHSLISIPLAAPLSIGRFDEILFAATCDPSFSFDIWPIGTIPSTDEKIVWGDLITKHDGFILRTEKTQAISDFMHDHELVLKVCSKPVLNCNSCEKCYRTIISLIVQGVDPNDCGFKVDEGTFTRMREHFEKSRFKERAAESYYLPLQDIIPKEVPNYPYNSQEFYKWFKELDLYKTPTDSWVYRKVYNKLPYGLAKIYEQLLRFLRINIHICYFPKKHRKQFQKEPPRISLSDDYPIITVQDNE